MIAPPLDTDNPRVKLVYPDIERDAPLGVIWLEGETGRHTLKLMGVADADNKPTDIVRERERVGNFIHGPNQLNWMIEFDGQVVGYIWVDLTPNKYLNSPSVHIMIGDPHARGAGIGSVSVKAVIDYLSQAGHKKIYSRYLLINTGSSKLLHGMGFQQDGPPYKDADNLEFQNVVLKF